NNATTSTEQEILVCHRTWLVRLLIATLAMFPASLVNIVLGFVTYVLDLAMNILKNLRGNPHFDLSISGAILDDRQRPRILKNVMVRFGDVAPEEKVGHLAVG
ncbi:hypothetical protein V2W45_1219933, partial [Cenococcum geophilum]